MAMYMFAIPFIVVDTNNKTIEGILTNVEKNWYGTYTIYIRTDKNEKYCTENKLIVEFAKKELGREVILGKGTASSKKEAEQEAAKVALSKQAK